MSRSVEALRPGSGSEARRAIAASAYFGGLSAAAHERLAACCRPVALRRRRDLFLEGSQGNAVYLLVAGALRLHKTTPDGNEVVLRTVRPGEVFAEVILFESRIYPATATAVTECRLLAFERPDLLALLGRDDFRTEFLAMLMGRLRYLAERVRYLTAYDVEQRFLLFLRDHYGARASIDVDIPKKDVAAAIGATPETFSRLLQRMKAAGRLRWEGKRIRLPDGFWEEADLAAADTGRPGGRRGAASRR